MKKRVIIEKQLKKYRIERLYNMAPKKNIPSMLVQGILCRNKAKGVPHRDLSDRFVQKNREYNFYVRVGKDIYDYVPLIFAPDTPMQYILLHPASTKERNQIIKHEEIWYLSR